MLQSVIDYYRSIMLHAPFASSVSTAPTWTTQYDVTAWRDADFERPLFDFRHDKPQEHCTAVDPKTRALILSRIETFGEHPQGLGRVTRTMFAQDLRRKLQTAE